MSVNFINEYEPHQVADMPGYVEVARDYYFDFEGFDAQQDAALEDIFKHLPEYVGGEGKWAEWFGEEKVGPPFLWSSLEATYILQVYGVLRREDWEMWESLFHDAIEHASLPPYVFPPPPKPIWSRIREWFRADRDNVAPTGL